MSGGCRAICRLEPRFEVLPKALSANVITGDLSQYGALYNSLESHNLEIIGVEFFSDVRQLNGQIPPEWRAYHRRSTTAWPCEEITQKWRDIGKSAYSQKMGRLWDLADRISHQLRVAGWRLRQISEAYHQQLNAQVLADGGFKASRAFDNAFVWQSYVEIHSFLVDACIVRDYLAEFAAHFVYGPRMGMERIGVTTAASLKKLLMKVKDADALTTSLQTAISDSGWLQELGAYRDLVMHVAPLARAGRRLFASNCTLLVGGLEQLPFTVCPIPDDPERIMASRNRGDFFHDFSSQWETYAAGIKDGLPRWDGLKYSHIALSRLTELAESLSEHSPVVPKKMLFELNDPKKSATLKFVE